MKGKGIPWILAVCAWICMLAGAAHAQNLHAVATVDPKASELKISSEHVHINLALSTSVPFRVFTLSAPDRLILDFQEVDWAGLSREKFLRDDAVTGVRFGVFQPGWSRMVLDLVKPMTIKSAELTTKQDVALEIVLEPASREDFEETSGRQDAGRWLREPVQVQQNPKKSLRIAIDPGHGGVDPGAVRQGIKEKDIVLKFSQELADVIRQQTGFEVVLIRDADISVSLSDRVRLARDAQADLLLSIHADTVTEGNASGASVNTLSDRASDASSAKLAELQNRADLAAGLEGHVEGDDVARVLVDLSRVDTNARSKIFAAKLIESLHNSVGVLRTKPHRSAGFKVLKAHDIPSVLLEIGFMSNARDRENMQTPDWRHEAAVAVSNAIKAWSVEDKERSNLVLK